MWTKEQKKEYMRKYRAEHKEHIRETKRKWEKEHKKERRKYNKKWEKTHLEHHKKCNKERLKRWRKTHREKWNAQSRRRYARRRGLGCVELNVYFKGSHGHHIDRQYIVYIPMELHNSIPHNVRTGHNMDKINTVVFKWLEKQNYEWNKKIGTYSMGK